MNLKQAIAVFIEYFLIFENWEQRYEYLIELGKSSFNTSSKLHKNENLILECLSRVWLEYYYNGKKLYFNADSDALIPKGITFILIRIYSNKLPKEIIKYSINYFFKKIWVNLLLSSIRLKGIICLYEKIISYTLISIEK